MLPASLLGTGPMGLVLQPKPAPVVASHGARAGEGGVVSALHLTIDGRGRRAAARQSGQAQLR